MTLTKLYVGMGFMEQNSDELKSFEKSIDNSIQYPFIFYKEEEDVLYYLETEEPNRFEEISSDLLLVKAINSEDIIGFGLRNPKRFLKILNMGE